MRRAVQVLSIFSALWIGLAVSAWQSPSPLAWIALVAPLGLLTWAISGRIGERSPPELRQAMRQVKIWSIAEGIAIFVALLVLNYFHLARYALAAVIALVGLHFLPLAHRLAEPRYYALGAALLAIAAWGTLVPRHDPLSAALAGACLFLAALSLAIKGYRRSIYPS